MDLKPFHRTNYNVNLKITTLPVFGSLYCLRKLSKRHENNMAIAIIFITAFHENQFLAKLCYAIVTICSMCLA